MAGPRTAEREGERRGRIAGPRPPSGRRARRLRLPRRRTLLVLLVLAVALTGSGTWVVYGSDWLRIERVTVEWAGNGPVKLTEDQIIGAADVPVGSPLASLDTGDVRARLLDRLPRLDSAEIVRAWPRSVTLRVTERTAAVLLAAEEGYAEVDDEGVRFGHVTTATRGVPVLELDLSGSPSRHRYGEDRVLRATAAMAAGLPDALRRQIGTIRVTSYDAVTLELSGNRTVNWGSPEESGAKAEALTALMKAAGDATYFDVSVPSAPAASGG